jgi:hypothetical protein
MHHVATIRRFYGLINAGDIDASDLTAFTTSDS